MFIEPVQEMKRRLAALALLLFLTARLAAAPTGPTLHFDYGRGQPLDNPLGKFMYFVPLISPEAVSVFTNAGNTQCARVASFHCRTNGGIFHATCEFDFDGDGVQRNVFDHATILHRRQKELLSGKPLAHQLASINVHGTGSGSVEIDGTLTNGQRTVTEVRLRFNSRGHASPVSISLQDICLRDGALHFENEIVARVNALTFLQKSGAPKMVVTLASVKKKDAGDGLWQNFVGGLKGAAANLLLPPLNIAPDGHQAMLDFGLALATQQPTFSFPFAARLKANLTIAQQSKQ
jgi:hypothetical protein